MYPAIYILSLFIQGKLSHLVGFFMSILAAICECDLSQ